MKKREKRYAKRHEKGPIRIGVKIGIAAGIGLLISLGIILILCVSAMKMLTFDILEKDCVKGTNMLAYELSKEGSGNEISDYNAFLDDLKEKTGCDYTIFKGNIRTYTTITQNGERAVGTPLAEDIAEKVLEKGESFVGQAKILDIPYVTSYVPTEDDNGNINGLLCASMSTEESTGLLRHTILFSVVIGIVLLAAASISLDIFLKRSVSAPLAKLTNIAHYMEKGELTTALEACHDANIQTRDEVGLLARTFENTISSLKTYVDEISSILEQIASNNLSVSTTIEYIGDFHSVQVSLDNIIRQLNNTLWQIVTSADQVSAGSEQVSSGAQALAQGTTEQASSVEELSATITNISEHVQQTASNAQIANERSSESEAAIAACDRQMQKLISAMNEINRQSEEIGKIIKVIEDISFQTNLLALNAAVEAVRAGTAGKGFAVVADEVRNLANKSSDASKNSAVLIDGSIQAVTAGMKIVDETADTLSNVVSASQEASSVISQITAAAQEQASEISQITQGIDQISSVVHTNSATAEQSAATSQELSGQAQLLQSLVDAFQLKKEPAE